MILKSLLINFHYSVLLIHFILILILESDFDLGY